MPETAPLMLSFNKWLKCIDIDSYYTAVDVHALCTKTKTKTNVSQIIPRNLLK